jgi:hypothetical protein
MPLGSSSFGGAGLHVRMIRTIFGNIGCTLGKSGWLGAELYTEIATSLELDLPAFNTCLENDDYIDLVETDLDFALTTGVRGTPTFFINGLALVGAQPIEVFTEVIDAELKAINSLSK